MKYIELKGEYRYYRHKNGKVGIKVFKHSAACSPEEARELETYNEVLDEFHNAKEFRKKLGKLTYRPIAVVIVKDKGHYYAGLKMEHIEGKMLSRVTRKELKKMGFNKKETVIEIAQQIVRDKGLYHDDLHRYNLMIAPSRKTMFNMVVVDLSPEYSGTGSDY